MPNSSVDISCESQNAAARPIAAPQMTGRNPLHHHQPQHAMVFGAKRDAYAISEVRRVTE